MTSIAMGRRRVGGGSRHWMRATWARRGPALGLLMGALVTSLSCAGKPPPDLGLTEGALAPCPPSPNCVSSDATDSAHRVEPFSLAVPDRDGWRIARQQVAHLTRTTIVVVDADYLHAECRSALFGFVDDLELQLREDEGRIEVRSAARLGYSDLGVNRRRVERLREALRARGAVR